MKTTRLVVLMSAMIAAACEDRAGQYNHAALSGLESKVRTVLAVEGEFKDRHKSSAFSAQVFIAELQEEGFSCHAWYVRSVRFNEQTEAAPFRLPVISCVQSPARIKPCVEFRVVLRFPSQSQAELAELVRRLPDLEASEASYVCEINPITAETKNSIELALRNGDAVEVKP